MVELSEWAIIGSVALIIAERVIRQWKADTLEIEKINAPPVQMIPINVLDTAMGYVSNAIVMFMSKLTPDKLEVAMGLTPQQTIPDVKSKDHAELLLVQTQNELQKKDLNDLQLQLNKSNEFAVAKGHKTEYEQYMKD